MDEQELNVKIDEIRSEHFSRMAKDLAPYLAQLKVYTDARLDRNNQRFDGRYDPRAYDQINERLKQQSENWGNAPRDHSRNLRAMTQEELDEFFRKHGRHPGDLDEPRRGIIGALFGLPLPF